MTIPFCFAQAQTTMNGHKYTCMNDGFAQARVARTFQ